MWFYPSNVCDINSRPFVLPNLLKQNYILYNYKIYIGLTFSSFSVVFYKNTTKNVYKDYKDHGINNKNIKMDWGWRYPALVCLTCLYRVTTL